MGAWARNGQRVESRCRPVPILLKRWNKGKSRRKSSLSVGRAAKEEKLARGGEPHRIVPVFNERGSNEGGTGERGEKGKNVG